MDHADGFGKVTPAQADVIAIGILIAKCLACGCLNCAHTVTGCLNNAGPAFKRMPDGEGERLKLWAEDWVLKRGLGEIAPDAGPPENRQN